MSKPHVTHDQTFKGLLINTTEELGSYTRILQVTHAVMDGMGRDLCKFFFMRFDVHYPGAFPSVALNNVTFRSFIAKYVRDLRRAELDARYLWVREQDSSPRPHYHVILLLDGNKTWSTYCHLREAERQWAAALGVPEVTGLIHYCDDSGQNGVMVHRGDTEAFEHCFYWSSYLAKTNTKSTPEELSHVRPFGYSSLT